MRQDLTNTPDDIQWCKDVHLQGLHGLRFASFVIVGNDDSPEELHLYADAEPRTTDFYIRVTFPGGKPCAEIPGFDTEGFVSAYETAALWSSTDSDDTPLEDNYSPDDLAPECRASMRADCLDFIGSNLSDLLEYRERMRSEQWSGEERAGHDFWLTRNGHGAGFWDRGLEDLGDRLSDAAQVYSGVDLYPGDDGLIYEA